MVFQFGDLSKISVDSTKMDVPFNWTKLVSNTNKMVKNLNIMMGPQFFEEMSILPDLPGYTAQVTSDKFDKFMETLGRMDTMDVSK